MKRLPFLDGVAILDRDQQKHIFGGNGGDDLTHAPIGDGGVSGCHSHCSNDSECPSPYNGCYTYDCGDGTNFKQCGY